jgi:PIN domain nuclease of toxin-antitoxin system
VNLLLDTHTFYWFVAGDRRLSDRAIALIEADENEAFVSIGSLWEMAIKVGNGKWPEAARVVDNFDAEIAAGDFLLLQLAVAHVRAAGLMQSPHRDPFDRLLAAQAQIEGLTLITADAKLSGLGAPVLW